MIKKLFFLAVILHFCNITPNYICESNGGFIGDHLTSLYNAYVLAKKYNLQLVLEPFGHCELFQCYNMLQLGRPANTRIIYVRQEREIAENLHMKNVAFCINVLTERPAHDAVTAAEAKQLVMLNEKINLDYLTTHENRDALTIAVHVRKGNDSNAEGYVGPLASQQIFDFNRSNVHYIHEKNHDPFVYFKMMRSEKRDPADRFWTLKFPPVQYYIDQVKRIVNTRNTDRAIVVKIFTDDINPQALLNQFKNQINNANVMFEFYDNKSKDYSTRIIEDLHLMSQCEVLIRAKSGFPMVAEMMGNFKTVIFPIEARWEGSKSIMSTIVIKGQYI